MKKSTLQFNDLEKMAFYSDLQFSPEAKKLAYVKTHASLKEDAYLSDLYIYDRKEKKHRRLTVDRNPSKIEWIDEETISFFSASKDEKRKDESILYEISLSGGEAVEKESFPFPVLRMKALGDNNYLLTKPVRFGEKDLFEYGEKVEEERSKRKDDADYEVFEEAPFWENGGSFTAGMGVELVTFDAKNKKKKVLSPKNKIVTGLTFDPEEKRALVLCLENKGILKFDTDLFELDLKTLKLRKLPLKNKRIYRAFYYKDRILLVINPEDKHGLNQNPSLFEYDEKKNELTLIQGPLCLGNTVGTDARYGAAKEMEVEGDTIYTVETRINSGVLVSYSPEEKVLIDTLGSVDGFDVKNGELAVIHMLPNKLQEIFIGGECITTENEAFLETKEVSPVEEVTVVVDGEEVHGYIVKPIGYKKGKKYPAVFEIHGGPKTVYGSVYHHEMQLLAAEGYFVYFCNPVGSDGRGDEFSDIRGKYGTKDYDQLMAFSDMMLQREKDIDKDNVFVVGGSYGGFMTNWIVGHTDRFRAACTQRSITNWTSMWGISDIGYYFVDDQMGCNPWENFEKLWHHSPLKYAKNIKTPLLILHADKDYRCPVAEGMQLFTALKYFKKETRMVIFHDENHELSRSGKPKHRERRMQEISSWFKKYQKIEKKK
ncbi:alpha/beta hydrolase family protein [Guggenheimella bovis]